MDPLKEKIINVLNFSPAEKRGMLVLIFIMIGIIYIPPLFQKSIKDSEKIKIETKYYTFKNHTSIPADKPALRTGVTKLFDFDPNQVGAKELKELGFPDFLIERIVKYRNSGGIFYSKEDLKRIYGLKEYLYNRIEGHIKIQNRNSEVEFVKEKKIPLLVNINEVDSFGLLSIKGIGPVFAGRILKYRNSLGGFSHLDQLKEVYGIDDSLYNKISGSFLLKDVEYIRRIYINKVDVKELRKHPYFRDFKLSQTILRYRDNHGPFKSISDMNKIHIVNDSIIQKIKPYISFSLGNSEENMNK